MSTCLSIWWKHFQSGQALAILRELAAWRDVKSRELNRQPGLLFRDETLRAIAVQAPQTLSDLKCVQSVSAAALAQYVVALCFLSIHSYISIMDAFVNAPYLLPVDTRQIY